MSQQQLCIHRYVNVEQSQKSLFSVHNLVIYTPIKASSTKVAKKVGTARVGHCHLAITYLHNCAIIVRYCYNVAF